MFCQFCGKELNEENRCVNPLCSSNTESSTESSNENNFNNESNTSYENGNSYTNSNENNFQGEGNFQNNPMPGNNFNANSLDISNDEFIAFVGEKNTEYYLDKLDKFKDNQNFASWNWAAFFLDIYWMLYRKMYKLAGIVFAITFCSSIFLGGFATIVGLAIRIGIGVYGNQLYIKDATKKISNIKRFSSNSLGDLSMRLRSAGGTNLVAPLVLAGVAILFILLAVFFFAAFFAAFLSY